ncbi:MAG: GNAT family N-acetyltransferase, partial [Pseudomonadota bacterium]
MILRDAVSEDRALLERFTIALQDFERERELNRRPGAEMAAEHIDALDAWADASPVSAHLIAEIDAVPTGWLFFAVYEEEEKITPEETRASGSISSLWVEPKFRRQGIASALIAEAEARMR